MPASRILFQDDFDVPTALAHALFGQPYMTFVQQNGQGCLTALQPNLVLPAMYAEPIMADFRLDVDIAAGTASPDSQAGIIFRSDDEADGLAYYYLLNLQPAYNRMQLQIWDRDWGTQTDVSVPPGLFSAEGNNHLRIEARDSTFRISLNSVVVREIQNFTLPEPGIFGLSLIAANASETVCFDNFTLSALP
jgi:hypothetical protein